MANGNGVALNGNVLRTVLGLATILATAGGGGYVGARAYETRLSHLETYVNDHVANTTIHATYQDRIALIDAETEKVYGRQLRQIELKQDEIIDRLARLESRKHFPQ